MYLNELDTEICGNIYNRINIGMCGVRSLTTTMCCDANHAKWINVKIKRSLLGLIIKSRSFCIMLSTCDDILTVIYNDGKRDELGCFDNLGARRYASYMEFKLYNPDAFDLLDQYIDKLIIRMKRAW